MILSKRVALNGQQLDELNEAIVIRSIDPGVPNESISAVDKMGGFGQRITGSHYNTLDVSVSYAINLPKERMAERRAIFDAVNAWANRPGWLSVNWMSGRRMYVDKAVLPGSGDLWQWTNEFNIVFRAYNVPFWQDELPSQSSSGIASSGSVWIGNAGNTRSVVDATFQNRSGMTINNFSISAGGNTLRLSSMGLGGSETLRIHHGTDGLLRLQIGSRSVYDRYRGDDDLYVGPGGFGVSYGADRAGILTAQCYGRWI